MLLAISGFPYNSAWRGFVLFNCFVGVFLMQIGTWNMVKPVKWSSMNQFFTSVFFFSVYSHMFRFCNISPNDILGDDFKVNKHHPEKWVEDVNISFCRSC